MRKDYRKDMAFCSSFCEPVPPCGACRQVLTETESRQKCPMRVLLVGKDKVLEFASASDLLPFIFTSNELKK